MHTGAKGRGPSARTPGGDRVRPKAGGYVLALATVVLMLIAGLALHLLTEARLRLSAAEQAWERDRLAIAAEAAARRALQACADLASGVDPGGRTDAVEPDAPHVLWSFDGTDPAGIRTRVRLMDAQRRFDLGNLAAREPGAPPTPEAIRIAEELLRLHGDADPAPRVAALARFFSAATSAVEPDGAHTAAPGPAAWTDIERIPGFSRNYLRDPAAGRPGWAGLRRALPAIASLLPHPPDAGPLPVNLNTAGRETLQALLGPGQQAAVDRLLARRRVALFGSVEEAAATTGLAADRLAALVDWVTVDSEWFEIESRAETEAREVTLYVLARRDPQGQVTVIRWVR